VVGKEIAKKYGLHGSYHGRDSAGPRSSSPMMEIHYNTLTHSYLERKMENGHQEENELNHFLIR